MNQNEWYKNYNLIIPKPLETIIKVTLANGDELTGVLPHFEFKDKEFNQTNYLLVPKENIETVRNLPVEKKTFKLDMLSKHMYVIPKKALARIQLFRESKTGHKERADDKPSRNISKVP